MKIYELMNKVKVENIGVRLCKNEQIAKNREYKDTSIKYWGSLDDMPAEFATYELVSSNVKNNTLFCWCIKNSIKVKDILECTNDDHLRFFNYFSEHDSYTRNHEHCLSITDLKGIEECEVVDIETNDFVDIYVFKNNVKSNIFDSDYDGILRFYEI